jgi:DNA-binding NarL/FixJ family response regulator
MALRQAIERLGYSVLDAAGAAGATLLGATYPEPIDLVLADLDLPASNGVAVVRWLLLHRPRLRYVFMTGHTEEWLTAMALTDLDGCVLHKPVSVH